MNVGELKKRLDEYPDDLPVYLIDHGHDFVNYPVESLVLGKAAPYAGRDYAEVLSEAEYQKKVQMFASLEAYRAACGSKQDYTGAYYCDSRYEPNKRAFENTVWVDCLYFLV